MYEYFEHTADLGIRVRAPDLNTMFAEACTALFASVLDGRDTVQHQRHMYGAITGSELDYLRFDWLRELLYRFDVEHLLLSRFEVSVGGDGLKGSAWGEPIDAARHVLS